VTRTVVLGLVALSILGAAACGGGRDEPVRLEAQATPIPPGWSTLPAPPFYRFRGAAVWTGTELVYWGGESEYGDEVHGDGAAFNPATGTWRPLARGPLSARSGAAAVWTGDEVLIWGGGHEGTNDGAAYDPAADEWRTLPASPLGPRIPVGAVWTGTEMLVWGDASRAASAVDGAAYDPEADRWRELPPAPFALNEATADWTGDELIVFGANLDGNNWSDTEHARGAAFDPATDEWRMLPPYPFSPQASTAVWTGNELIVWDYELRAAAYDPGRDEWRPLPKLPLDFSECYPEGALGDGLILAWHCGEAVLLDLATDSWRPVERPPPHIFAPPVAAGPVFLFVGAYTGAGDESAWAYRPGTAGAPPAPGATTFVPEAPHRGERAVLPLTFPDGSRIVLSYPARLRLAELGVQPDVSYLYREDSAARYPLTFLYGVPSHAASAGEIVLRTGAWTIVAPIRDSAARDEVARSLSVHETVEGFVVVEAATPLALSHEFGEGGGVMLAFGDGDPAPARVTSLDPLIELAPGDCGGNDTDVEGVGGSTSHGSTCLGGRIYVGIYGNSQFIEAVLSGLELEEWQPPGG
jgi:hypothetical protein